MLDALVQDVRFALRLLRKSPLFTATAALSLAIGIGANTTIFSVANALLLRPLPGLAQPDRLVDLGRTDRGEGFDTVGYHYYRGVRERSTTLSGVYAYRPEPTPMSLGGQAEAERIYGTIVSGNYFTVLGTRPALGRMLADSDDVSLGAHPVAVISHELWERRFASDPALVGQNITVNGHQFAVVGVTPRGFQGTTLLKADIWISLSMLSQAVPTMRPSILTERRAVWLVMGGRLNDGVTPAQAQAELDAISGALAREFPTEYRDRGLKVAPSGIVPGHTGIVATFVGLLMGIVGLVLLIACVNVAGMMLARAAARQREIAVRLAIGAGRGQLVRQLLTEAIVLFSAGGLAGLVLSRWLTALLMTALPQLPFPISLDITTDWRVLAFTVALSLVAAVASGLAPALQASHPDLVPALRTEGLGGGGSRLRLRNAFVVGQVTMSLLLVIAAGLFIRTLQHAADAQPGFNQQNVDVVSLDLSVAGYRPETGPEFTRALLGRVQGLPGVESAAVTVDLPLDGGRMGLGRLRRPGQERGIGADANVVEPGFFTTLQVRLTRGRDFTVADTATSPGVIIVSEALARRMFGEADPIGQQLLLDTGLDGESRNLTVVGVAADAHMVSLGGAPEPYFYVPYAQQYMARIAILIRRRGPDSMIPQVRALIREMNPNLPVTEALPLSEVTAIGLVPQRVAASVAGSLGLVGLLLAAIGIYGVTSYAVSRRTREIGIRMALGADRRSVLGLVLRQGFVLAAIGVAIGIAIAAAGSRLLESLLFGVRGIDPVTFGGACMLFALVTLAATYVPARRAARVDPMAALRSE